MMIGPRGDGSLLEQQKCKAEGLCGNWGRR